MRGSVAAIRSSETPRPDATAAAEPPPGIGEGDANAAEYRIGHERYWNGYIDDLRRRLGDPSFALTDDTMIVCQRFRIVARIDPESGAVTWVEPVTSAT